MISDWFIVVRGSPPELAALADLCGSSTLHTLHEEQPGEWRLRSTTVSSGVDHEAAWPGLCELLVRLADVAAAAATIRVRLTPGHLGRGGLDGRTDIYVHPEPVVIRARAFAPTVIVDGVVPEPVQERLLRLTAVNDHLRLALHFLNADMSWFNLWKAFEAIRGGNQGEKNLVAAGWAADAEIRRFRLTANSYSAVGDAARHAKLEMPSPLHPMTLERADDFVRDLLFRWAACRAARRRRVGASPPPVLRLPSAPDPRSHRPTRIRVSRASKGRCLGLSP